MTEHAEALTVRLTSGRGAIIIVPRRKDYGRQRSVVTIGRGEARALHSALGMLLRGEFDQDTRGSGGMADAPDSKSGGKP